MSIVLCELGATSKLRQAVYLSVMKFLREMFPGHCASRESFARA